MVWASVWDGLLGNGNCFAGSEAMVTSSVGSTGVCGAELGVSMLGRLCLCSAGSCR